MNSTRGWLSLSIAVAIVLLGHRQLLAPRSFDSQDHVDGYVRAIEYATEWKHGHWAQSLPDAYFGAGDAFPRYYPPISHVTAAGAYLIARSPILATHLTGLLAVVLGCVFLALVVFRLTRAPALAAFAGALYALTPYNFLQLQVRGAFAEAWAAAWYPLILLAALKSGERGRVHLLYPIAIALLLLSHTVMTLWVLPMLLLVAVCGQAEQGRAAKHAIAAGLLGAMLASFHLISILTGMPSVRASDPEALHATPAAIVTASERFGHATATPILFPALGITCLLAAILAARARAADLPRRLAAAALVAAFGLAAVVVAPRSFWDVLPQELLFIQFPSRLLSPVSMFLALAVGVLLRNGRAWSSTPVLLGLVLAGGATTYLAGRRSLMPRSLGDAGVHRLVTSDFSTRGFNVDQAFLPRGSDPGDLVLRVQEIQRAVGSAPLVSWNGNGPDPRAEIVLDTAAQVTLPLVAYDFHDPRLENGRQVSATSDHGLLSLTLPAGRHMVTVERRIPPAVQAGMLVSLSTLAILALWSLARLRVRTRAA